MINDDTIISQYSYDYNGNIVDEGPNNMIRYHHIRDHDSEYGLYLLNTNPNVSEIYLFKLVTEITSFQINKNEKINLNLRYHILDTGQIDLIIHSISYRENVFRDDNIILNLVNKLNDENIKSKLYYNKRKGEKELYISNINVSNIDLIKNIIAKNIYFDKSITTQNIYRESNTVNYKMYIDKNRFSFKQSFRIAAKIIDYINTEYDVIKYLLLNDSDKSILYMDNALKNMSKDLDVIPEFIKLTIDTIEYYPYIEAYGKKYLELIDNKMIKKYKYVQFVNYALAHVIMSKLGSLTDEEKELGLKYILNAGDIEGSNLLRNKLFFDYMGFPIQSTAPFNINNNTDTIINLAKLIKECKKHSSIFNISTIYVNMLLLL